MTLPNVIPEDAILNPDVLNAQWGKVLGAAYITIEQLKIERGKIRAGYEKEVLDLKDEIQRLKGNERLLLERIEELEGELFQDAIETNGYTGEKEKAAG